MLVFTLPGHTPQQPQGFTRRLTRTAAAGAAANRNVFGVQAPQISYRHFPASARIPFSVDPFFRPSQPRHYCTREVLRYAPRAESAQPGIRRSGGDLANVRYRYLWPWQGLIWASPDCEGALSFLLFWRPRSTMVHLSTPPHVSQAHPSTLHLMINTAVSCNQARAHHLELACPSARGAPWCPAPCPVIVIRPLDTHASSGCWLGSA